MFIPFTFSPKLIILSVIAAIGLTLGTVGYFKYTSMVGTIKEQSETITALTAKVTACENLTMNLEYGIDQQNLGIEELKSKNEELAAEVEESKAKIRKIRQERDKALDHLGRVPVPASCEAKFDWMIDRAQEITK
jgi:peptidoglycan hydrolase CwlO-like protein